MAEILARENTSLSLARDDKTSNEEGVFGMTEVIFLDTFLVLGGERKAFSDFFKIKYS